MISDIVISIFNQAPTSIDKIEKGLTNQNFKIIVANKPYVLRVPYKDSEHIVDRHLEQKALALVKDADIDVTTVYFDAKTGIKVTEYVDGLIGFNEFGDFDKFLRVGKLMRKLHDLKQTIGHEFDPLDTYQRYRKHVSKPLISHQNAQPYLDFIHINRTVSTMCHNDWVPDNIGFHPTRDYLLDYEYAGDNDPMFDVTSFLSENNITNPIHRDQFLMAYFDHQYPPQLHKTLLFWEAFHHILWCCWAQMMFEQRKKAIYSTIALDKKRSFEIIDRQLYR